MANSFYLDASALAKRYAPEIGSAQIDLILDTVAANRIYLLNVGAGEVVSILVRKRNAGIISIPDFGQALASFDTEIVRAADITKVAISNRLALSSFPLIVAYSINSTDALILKSALAIARRLRAAGDDLVLVASDQRRRIRRPWQRFSARSACSSDSDSGPVRDLLGGETSPAFFSEVRNHWKTLILISNLGIVIRFPMSKTLVHLLRRL
jgi:predicted nucleic acid-binding protein